VLFVILNVMLTLLIVEPITRLSHAAEQISKGRLDAAEIPETGRDEVSQLDRRSTACAAAGEGDPPYRQGIARDGKPPTPCPRATRCRSTASRRCSALAVSPHVFALDENLHLRVAVKEYLPADIALARQTCSIAPRSEETVEIFDWGKRRFLDESRTLAPLVPPPEHRARDALLRGERHRRTW